jgi:hypothetical protein
MRRRYFLFATMLLAGGLASASSARAECVDGITVACVKNGCPGERTCLSGHMSGCVIDPEACPVVVSGPDFLIADNSPGNAQVGLCVDGRDTVAEIDDLGFVQAGTAPSTTFDVGDFQPSSVNNEVIGFARTRAPSVVSTPWTSGGDTLHLTLDPTVRVPITVWIVTAPGTFAAQALQALSTVIQAGALFDQERVGLDWSQFDIRDATSNPNQPNFQNTTSTGNLETQIGHVTGRINVYWVPNVNGGSGNGVGEVADGDSVAVGAAAAPGLLAHEIGHNLALDHIDGDARFDGTNVMMSAGGTRLFLTEGQAYRAHIRSISAIRSARVYALRPGMPIIDTCNISSTTRTCPKADKRLFADGASFPPN